MGAKDAEDSSRGGRAMEEVVDAERSWSLPLQW